MSGQCGQGPHAQAAVATGGGGPRTRSRSPRSIAAVTRGRSQTTPATDGSNSRRGGARDGDQAIAAASMTRSRPRPAWQQQQEQQKQQEQEKLQRNRAQEMYRPEFNRKGSADTSSAPSNPAGAAAVVPPDSKQQNPRLRSSRSAHANPAGDESPLPPLRRRVLRSGGTGGAHASASVSKTHVTGAGRRNGSAVVERGLGQPLAGSGRRRDGEGGLRVAGGGDGDNTNALDPAPDGREQDVSVPTASCSKDVAASSAVVPRARTAVPGRGEGHDTSSTAVVQSRRRHEQEAATREEAEAQEKQRRRERGGKEASAGGRHRETLAFMARQRKQATNEKRRAEQEKLENAKNLRRALEASVCLFRL